jgi:hypothetical protein
MAGVALADDTTTFGRMSGRAQEQRDAQTALATMDHADIRGLVTAFHLSVAGLPAL